MVVADVSELRDLSCPIEIEDLKLFGTEQPMYKDKWWSQSSSMMR